MDQTEDFGGLIPHQSEAFEAFREGAPLTTGEAAALTGYHIRHIALLCRQGKFPGAVKRGRDWLIPAQSLAKYEPGPQGFAAVKARAMQRDADPKAEQ